MFNNSLEHQMGWMKHAFVCCLRYLRLAKDQQEVAKKVEEEVSEKFKGESKEEDSQLSKEEADIKAKKKAKKKVKREARKEVKREATKEAKKETKNKVKGSLSPTFYEDAMVEILMGGGDTDTNACIAGGLIGAIVGFDALPEIAKNKVLSWDNNKKEGHERPEFLVPKFHAESLIERLYDLAPTDLRTERIHEHNEYLL